MKRHRLTLLLAVFALVAAACAGAALNESPADTTSSTETTAADDGPAPTDPSTTAVPATPAAPAAPPTSDDLIIDSNYVLENGLDQITGAWPTDWSRRTIELSELLPGIFSPDPRDRIRPIDAPKFTRVPSVEWLSDRDPGVEVTIGSDSRFYPLSVLTRHEIVNDNVGGVPVAVTYCPLCNTAVVFDRRLDGETIRLGVSGLLRNSDMVMWDRDTTSLWQQVNGEGIVGVHAGNQLTLIPSRIVSYGAFAEGNPESLAMSDDQGFGAVYGANPYRNYSSQLAPYSFFTAEVDPRLPALERVVGVDVGGEVKGYTFSALMEERVINDTVGGIPIVVWWGDPNTADALDGPSIPDSDGLGTAVAYLSTVDDQVLTFEAIDELTFRDIETGSTWSILGRATAGPLEGVWLELALHRNEFFFAWAAFFPDADLRM